MRLNIKDLRQQIKHYRRRDKNISARLLALLELAKLEEEKGVHDLNYSLVAARLSKTSRSIYRWKKIFLGKGAEGLKNHGQRGRRSSPIKGWAGFYIKQMRSSHGWGANVIRAHLRHYYGMNYSEHKIYKYLDKCSLIRRKQRPAYGIKAHGKIVKVLVPGRHTQMDVKVLTKFLSNKKKCYVYNFVDHASRWQFKRAYESYGPYETRCFMMDLLKVIPFRILRLQTDNGIEFTNKFVSHRDHPREHELDMVCRLNEIRLVQIPPGVKELNGLVERSHRQDDEEFYQMVKPRSLEEFNQMLVHYNKWVNGYRLRKPLGWITSEKYLESWRKNFVESNLNASAVAKLSQVA